MTLYLLKGYLDYAATSLADAEALFTALLDPTTAANAATIDRVTGKLEAVVLNDSGEPVTVVSIDDANGTVSSWITAVGTTAEIALGDPDPAGGLVYASGALTIAGNTRTGTLALNAASLRAALGSGYGRPNRGGAAGGNQFTLQIRKTASSITETMALLPVTVLPSVL